MNARRPMILLPGMRAIGTCARCGRRGVTGTVVGTASTQSATVRNSAHSHAHRSDDGDNRGNGTVRIEQAARIITRH